jgi:hypothetical protein
MAGLEQVGRVNYTNCLNKNHLKIHLSLIMSLHIIKMTRPRRKRLNFICHRKLEIVKFSQCYPKMCQQEVAKRFTALWGLEIF